MTVDRIDPEALQIFTVRHVTRDESERMSGTICAGMRWLIVDAKNPEGVHYADSMLGLPSGADYLIGAVKYARKIARRRGRRLVLSPEMAAFEAAKDGLEAALRLAR